MRDFSLKIHYYTEDLSVSYRYSSSKSPPGMPNRESNREPTLRQRIYGAVLNTVNRVTQKGTRLKSNKICNEIMEN
jgi:hypothetical protein